MIIHWPNGIPAARRGAIETQPGHVIDIMATCVDVSHVSYPQEVASQKIKPAEGVSLKPALLGDALQRKNPLFWEHEGNRAVREGPWKLVAKAGEPWELYDMTKDRTEMHNLAAANQDRVKAMAADWDAWAARADVLPLGGWKDPAAKK